MTIMGRRNSVEDAIVIAGNKTNAKANKVQPSNDCTTAAEIAESEKADMELRERVAAEEAKLSSIYDPRTSRFLPQWDMCVGVALLFTATITPYEVAFLEFEDYDALFAFNRMMDIIFAYDIFIQFHLAFYDSAQRAWVTDISSIRMNYAKTWMALDIISTIPYDLIDVVMKKTSDVTAGEESNSAAENLKVLRVLKILKLVKLLRILKSARIFVTMQRELGLSNGNASLIKFLATFMSFIHWIACVWGLGPQFEEGGVENSWYRVHGDIAPASRYALCVYTSVQMMVMGEAEDTRPVNIYEYVLAVFMMIIGGSVYAYVIGSICSIISLRDPARKEFKDMCDLVSQFCFEHALPQGLASQVHDYFRESEQLFRHNAYSKVVGRMSPSLRRAIAVHLHGEALYKVWFFNAADIKERTEFTAAVALILHPREVPMCCIHTFWTDSQRSAFPPGEPLYSPGHSATFMAIVTRGLANQSSEKVGHMKQLGKDSHFGEEMILSRALRVHAVRAITYLNCNILDRADLLRLLSDSFSVFPQTVKLIRRATGKLALRRAVASLARICRLMRVKQVGGDVTKATWNSDEVKAYKAGLMSSARQKTEKARKESPPKIIVLTKEEEARKLMDRADKHLQGVASNLAQYTSPALVEHFLTKATTTDGAGEEEVLGAAGGGDPGNKARKATGPPLCEIDSMDFVEGGDGAGGGEHGSDGDRNKGKGTGKQLIQVQDGITLAGLANAMAKMETAFVHIQNTLDEQSNTMRALHRDTQDLKTKL